MNGKSLWLRCQAYQLRLITDCRWPTNDHVFPLQNHQTFGPDWPSHCRPSPAPPVTPALLSDRSYLKSWNNCFRIAHEAGSGHGISSPPEPQAGLGQVAGLPNSPHQRLRTSVHGLCQIRTWGKDVGLPPLVCSEPNSWLW